MREHTIGKGHFERFYNADGNRWFDMTNPRTTAHCSGAPKSILRRITLFPHHTNKRWKVHSSKLKYIYCIFYMLFATFHVSLAMTFIIANTRTVCPRIMLPREPTEGQQDKITFSFTSVKNAILCQYKQSCYSFKPRVAMFTSNTYDTDLCSVVTLFWNTCSG
jgi:hypothetical protein